MPTEGSEVFGLAVRTRQRQFFQQWKRRAAATKKLPPSPSSHVQFRRGVMSSAKLTTLSLVDEGSIPWQ